MNQVRAENVSQWVARHFSKIQVPVVTDSEGSYAESDNTVIVTLSSASSSRSEHCVQNNTVSSTTNSFSE